jgi:hypothetical protein
MRSFAFSPAPKERNRSNPLESEPVRWSASCSASGGLRSLAGLLDFPMGESVEVSALRAGPATGLRVRALGMCHFIYDAALHASGRFTADEFFFFYDLHKILSVEKPSIIADFDPVPPAI